MRAHTILLGLLALGIAPTLAEAQRTPRAVTVVTDDERPVIGIGTSSGGKRDTLGLLISSITPGGPAEKAGLEEGNRIQAVNGVNLRLSTADAGEPDMSGIMTRRLTRELRKAKAGDEVELRVYADGRVRQVKVKTVEASELSTRGGTRIFRTSDADERPVIGLTLGGNGSRRDTLGVLVVNVQSDGPAEKAGIEEGNRIASINGVNLRVMGEDAGDADMANVRRNRFSRELRKVKPGDDVELRVYGNGQWRTVQLKAAKASDVYGTSGGRSFFFSDGEHGPVLAPMPPMPPMPPIRGRIQIDAPRIELETRHHEARQAMERAAAAAADAAADVDTEALRRTLETMREQYQETTRQLQDAQRRLRNTFGAQAAMSYAPSASGVSTATATGEGYTLALNGLRLTSVSPDLAEYLGEGSDRGLLVLDAEDHWSGIRAGDVLLSVNGRSVRNGERASLTFDESKDNTVVVLRKGVKTRIEIPRAR